MGNVAVAVVWECVIGLLIYSHHRSINLSSISIDQGHDNCKR